MKVQSTGCYRGEFSLASRLQKSDRSQRHHTALVGCFQLFTQQLHPPWMMIESSSSGDALSFYGTFIFSGEETHGTREGCLAEAVQFALRFPGTNVVKDCQSFLIWVMLISPGTFGLHRRWPVMYLWMKIDSSMRHEASHKLLHTVPWFGQKYCIYLVLFINNEKEAKLGTIFSHKATIRLTF